ncbi:MAG: hypothetical protein ACOZHQ_13175 [Thermodesulfobacteriota bacterium]
MPPKLTLDVPTFILASAMTALVQAGAMYFIYRTRKTYPGFGLWALTYLTHGVGLLLLMARGLIPDFVSVVVSNVMTSGTPLLTWIGAQVFFGRPRPRWPFVAVLCLLAAGLAYYWYIEPNLSARIVLIALVMGGLCLASAWDLWRLPGPDLRQASRFTALSMAAYGLLALSRAATPFTSQALDAPFQNTIFHGLFFMGSVLVGIIPSYGMITMNAQRLEGELNAREAEVRATVDELTQALAEVRTLSELLPICSACKKVRDDAGYWQQVDNYFAQHSGVRFSHGICPDCLARLYPDAAERMNHKDKNA